MARSIPSIAAVIVAAGKGSRAGGSVPKQFQSIGGRPILRRTLDAFLGQERVDCLQPVVGEDDLASYSALAPSDSRLLPPIAGGQTRQASVMAGLRALLPRSPDIVLIHDGARPFVVGDLIDRVIEGLERADAVVPTLPIASTVKAVDERGRITGTVARDGLHQAETPQGFRYAPLLEAHLRAAAENRQFTDDASIAEWAGQSVLAVAGDPRNVKLTTAADIALADRRLCAEETLRTGDVRVGHGYDVHAFGEGSFVTLGGVRIPHSSGLVGHSDADVGLHALTDAILGALAEEDIGAHFPPSEERWKGASSDRFLADAVARVLRRGGVVAHLDLTILAELPRIGPHRDAMRQRIAAICGIALGRVAVKATTNEGLGFVGRGEGIAAHATATLRLPFESASP